MAQALALARLVSRRALTLERVALRASPRVVPPLVSALQRSRCLCGSADAPLPAGWESATAPDGRTYYYRPGSQGTQWDRPTTDAAAHAAQDTLRDVFAAFEEARGATTDFFEPQLKDGELVLDLGPKGQYSLSQVAGQQQLMLFSPISGPQMYRFDADNGWWANELDGHLLNDLLVREIMHITSVYLNL